MIIKVYIFCNLVLLLLSVTLCEAEERIVGGVVTVIQEVPFLVQIYHKRRLICGGTLVTWQHVVTAAHCADGLEKELFQIVGGVSYQNEKGTTAAVEEVYIPQDYNQGMYFHDDVAVFKLATPLSGPSIQPTGGCSQNFQPGDEVQVYGWGKLSEDGRSSHQLQTVKLHVIGGNACAEMYNSVQVNAISESMFCTFGDEKDACQGDSGGPAIINGEFCGIVSWGLGCADARYPGVFTNVTHVAGFIGSKLY